MEEKQWIGMGLAIIGALFWGLSGTSVQFLENAKHLNVAISKDTADRVRQAMRKLGYTFI